MRNIYRDLNLLKKHQLELTETVRDICIRNTFVLDILHNVIKDLNKIKEGENHMKDIYIIEVIHRPTMLGKISQEGFTTLSAATDFIQSRDDKPEELSNLIYRSKEWEYRINIISIGE